MPYRSDWSDDDLDDNEYPDEPDDDESADTVRCPQCGADVYEDAPACPHCGHYLSPDTSAWSGRPLWWILIGLAGVVATIIALSRF